MIPDVPATIPIQPDTEGCLLVVAGYADIAQVLGPVTAEAAASINRTSPELGDFFELRFADIGPRSEAPSCHADAVSRIAAELTRPTSPTARYYFALVVADRSAAATEQLIEECQTHKVIAALPMRYRGLASTDDRRTAPDERASGTATAEIIISSAGAWDRVSLVRDLRSFATELLLDFAAGNEPGLTLSQLSQLSPARNQDSVDEQPQGHARADQAPPSDVLSPQREEPHPQPPKQEAVLWRPTIPPANRRPRHLPALWRGRHGTGPPADERSQDRAWTDQAPPSEVLSPQREEPHPQPPKQEVVLWRPTIPDVTRRPRHLPALRRGRHATRSTNDLSADEQPPDFGRVAMLILLGDEDTDDKGTWRRGRSVMLEIDKKFASTSQADYQVRTLGSTGNAAMSEPRRAGKLTRRDMRRPNASLDFPRILSNIRTAIKRDRVAGIAGSPTTRPVIIFFAADVPLADAVTTGIYGELADEASITWIVPQDMEDLLSPILKEQSTWVLPDHQAVADEFITLLQRTQTAETAEADPAITINERSAR